MDAKAKGCSADMKAQAKKDGKSGCDMSAKKAS